MITPGFGLETANSGRSGRSVRGYPVAKGRALPDELPVLLDLTGGRILPDTFDELPHFFIALLCCRFGRYSPGGAALFKATIA